MEREIEARKGSPQVLFVLPALPHTNSKSNDGYQSSSTLPKPTPQLPETNINPSAISETMTYLDEVGEAI